MNTRNNKHLEAFKNTVVNKIEKVRRVGGQARMTSFFVLRWGSKQ